MEDILVPLGLFGMVTAVIIFIASRRHGERMELIKKGISPITFNPPRRGNWTLLFGLIFVSIGLSLLISLLIGYTDDESLVGALICLLGGGSLLLYWKLTAGDRERAIRAYERYLEEEQSRNQMMNSGATETDKVV